MSDHPDHAPLRIAASFGALNVSVSRLLARQRAAEPETPVSLVETGLAEQIEGLENGRYDLGFSMGQAAVPSVSAWPLCREEIAVALPTRFPLLALGEIPLRELSRYPVVAWSNVECEPLSGQVDDLLNAAGVPLERVERVKSFGLMASLVAAGYGIALGTVSQIAAYRDQGIVMRPLARPRHYLTTYLLGSETSRLASAERFIARAGTSRPH
ncbi:LysR family substrate-binding domain-containing protein [Xanthobacter autotrophicus]|uniref:LysR family substrate-binding domain-containing protein n=1 Tax=Xanthobacter autotrophicus TaxID=280 RepID=UPI0037268FFE